MWVSAIFTAAGGLIVLVVLYLTLRGAWQAASPKVWATRYVRDTFVSFAWQELGRGLFLGYLFALGVSPVAAFFFLGQPDFWRSFGFLSLINWGLGAVVIYFVQLLPGLRGYVLHKRNDGAKANLPGQLLVVTAISAPIAWAFFALLLPPGHEFFRIAIETWLLYTRIVL